MTSTSHSALSQAGADAPASSHYPAAKPSPATPATWLITGCSSGIGLSLAHAAVARGDTVLATVRRADALTDLQRDYPAHLHVLILDLTDTEAVRRVVDAAFQAHGAIDVVVSNAAYGLFGAAEEVSDTQIRRQIDTNLVGSIQLIRAVLPHLRAQGGGHILQVSSEGGQIAYPNFSLYHATKWGIEGFVEATAQEVLPFGIEITLIEPGPTRTRFGTGLDSPPPMAVYDDTPAGDVRRAFQDRAFPLTGDPTKVAREMVALVDRHRRPRGTASDKAAAAGQGAVAAGSATGTPAPRRLLVGAASYDRVRAALVERIAALDAQRDIALSTEVDS
ncbi:SDR family oxidoreductase [Robbsia sp. KACC 23696]|uniref:SDR family oxidoreductase n=1 Tax=Robbsia sp. KACC 23696 TaxID=3149231 RepID=UPI00325C0C94